MRTLTAIVMFFTLLSRMGGCVSDELDRLVAYEGFHCRIMDEDNIAVGGLETFPESGIVFVPEQLEGYTVSRLGFSRGAGGNGCFYSSKTEQNEDGEEIYINIYRCYFPHTINYVQSDYMNHSGGLKVFYCGEVISLSGFDNSRENIEIYVPAEKYELFKEMQSQYFDSILLKANVSYHLNYDEDNYYYVDYYENGEKILYIPPIPQRDGYTFGGWFTEAECINQWDFDTDTIQLSEETEEIRLYAKWIAG